MTLSFHYDGVKNKRNLRSSLMVYKQIVLTPCEYILNICDCDERLWR